MKNIIFAFLAVFLLISCAKENKMEDTDFDLQTRSELTPEQRVAAFLPIADGNYNPAKTHSAGDAILGVETVLNYQYGDFRNKFDDTHSLLDTFTVNKENGIITDQVVSQIYDEVLQVMKCHYAGISATIKMELLVNLSIVEETSSQLKVGLRNIVGTLSSGILPGQMTFQPGDDWRVDIGKCNDPNHPGNAPKQIARAATFNLTGSAAQYGVWYSDFENVPYNDVGYETWFALNPNDPEPGDFIIDYFMWYFDGCDQFYPTNHQYYDDCGDNEPELPMRIEVNGELVPNPEVEAAFCIEWTGMNYYLANAQFIADKHAQLNNKTSLKIDIEFDWSPSLPANYIYFWRGNGTYGKKNIDATREVMTLGNCN